MSMQEKQSKRKNKKKKATEPCHITRAVTHIRLTDVNAVKLAALDAFAPVYLPLCQQYITLFCTEEIPNKLRDPLYETPLSERWHRVAIMQAAGVARSWRSNRANALQDYRKEQEKYEERMASYQEQQERGTPEEEAIKEPKAPIWHEWNIPTLREWCLQTNDKHGETLRKHARQAQSPTQERSCQTSKKSQVTRLSGEEGRREASIHIKPDRTKTDPTDETRNQSGRE
jgi:hypothetical protein